MHPTISYLCSLPPTATIAELENVAPTVEVLGSDNSFEFGGLRVQIHRSLIVPKTMPDFINMAELLVPADYFAPDETPDDVIDAIEARCGNGGNHDQTMERIRLIPGSGMLDALSALRGRPGCCREGNDWVVPMPLLGMHEHDRLPMVKYHAIILIVYLKRRPSLSVVQLARLRARCYYLPDPLPPALYDGEMNGVMRRYVPDMTMFSTVTTVGIERWSSCWPVRPDGTTIRLRCSVDALYRRTYSYCVVMFNVPNGVVAIDLETDDDGVVQLSAPARPLVVEVDVASQLSDDIKVEAFRALSTLPTDVRRRIMCHKKAIPRAWIVGFTDVPIGLPTNTLVNTSCFRVTMHFPDAEKVAANGEVAMCEIAVNGLRAGGGMMRVICPSW